MESTQPYELFGGAITAVLPSNVCDMSKFRQIPDNQEVFTHLHTDQSLIIEILEYVNAPNDLTALREHYNDITDSNDAVNSQVFTAEVVPLDSLDVRMCSAVLYLHAKQLASKYKELAKNEVDVHLSLYRLPQFTTDILVTFNDPTLVSVESSSHVGVPTQASRWSVDDFRGIVASLRVEDESIFGSS